MEKLLTLPDTSSRVWLQSLKNTIAVNRKQETFPAC